MPEKTRRDWFRSTSWNAEIEKDFLLRLRRAKPERRAQYAKIQAVVLLQSRSRATRDEGRKLLLRVVQDYPTSYEVASSLELLGDSLGSEGEWQESELYLNKSIELQEVLPTGSSGTSGLTKLRLAEVLLDSGRLERLPEVEQLLLEVEAVVDEQSSVLPDPPVRFLRAVAVVAHRRGEKDAPDLARETLELLAAFEARLGDGLGSSYVRRGGFKRELLEIAHS